MHMKKLFLAAMVAVTTFAFTSCGGLGMGGFVYQDSTVPAAVTSNAIGSKCGTAKILNVLGVVELGDAGINTAAKNGGISRVSHVDVKTFSILGVFVTYEYFVYGN